MEQRLSDRLLVRRNPPLPTHRHILRAMLDGAALKAHRTLDGEKTYTLHPLDGTDEIVERAAVETLKRHGLIISNMKFPAATYGLTEEGLALAQAPS